MAQGRPQGRGRQAEGTAKGPREAGRWVLVGTEGQGCLGFGTHDLDRPQGRFGPSSRREGGRGRKRPVRPPWPWPNWSRRASVGTQSVQKQRRLILKRLANLFSFSRH